MHPGIMAPKPGTSPHYTTIHQGLCLHRGLLTRCTPIATASTGMGSSGGHDLNLSAPAQMDTAPGSSYSSEYHELGQCLSSSSWAVPRHSATQDHREDGCKGQKCRYRAASEGLNIPPGPSDLLWHICSSPQVLRFSGILMVEQGAMRTATSWGLASHPPLPALTPL